MSYNIIINVEEKSEKSILKAFETTEKLHLKVNSYYTIVYLWIIPWMSNSSLN